MAPVPASYLAQLFMGLVALRLCWRLFPPCCELLLPDTIPVLFTGLYEDPVSEATEDAMLAMAAAA